MDARLIRAAVLCAAFFSLGASARTQNFIVTASNDTLAQEVATAAEKFRRDLAIEWLGRELPAWHGPCPITVTAAPQLGAGGATSFMFEQGRPFGWTMSVQGSRQRILDSVLPHEVTHTIFATHFGRALPRWADEGACTTVEHSSEREKQQRLLIEFLTTTPSRGIPFDKMFAMKEYPADVLPLYAQGFSVARFLIAQGGKQKFVQFIGDGMRTNDWTTVTQQHYGFDNLFALQDQWVEWVRRGSSSRPSTGVIARTLAETVPVAITKPAAPVRVAALPAAAPIPPRSATAQLVSAPSSASWYAQVRDQSYATAKVTPPPISRAGPAPTSHPVIRSASRPLPVGRPQAMVTPWSNFGGYSQPLPVLPSGVRYGMSSFVPGTVLR